MKTPRVRDNMGKFAICLLLVAALYAWGKAGADDTKPTINFTPSDRTATAVSPPPTATTGTEGDQLTLNGVSILVGRIWDGNEPNPFLGDRTCAPVAYRNMSDEPVDVSQYDWKLTTPGGLTLDATIGGANKMLPYGAIQPRGATEGHVCFDAKFTNQGRWTLVYQPSAWSSDKLTWTNQ